LARRVGDGAKFFAVMGKKGGYLFCVTSANCAGKAGAFVPAFHNTPTIQGLKSGSPRSG
jgi:hypothetical protein